MQAMRFNSLEVRLAENEADVDAAQALRYRVFYDEMGAKPTPNRKKLMRDVDPYDDICDHLLVIDLERGTPTNPEVVGTYRLLRGAVADATAGFYSEGEFDLAGLLAHPGEIMELGRSCINAEYRRRGAMQLLWRGIADYIFEHKVEVMFGCGSIHGTDVNEAKRALAFLHHFHRAPKGLRPQALAGRYVEMNTMKKKHIDAKLAESELPPLLKGYLRLGAYVGDGAVIDHQFNTIDVCVVVETEKVTGKYIRHFAKDKLTENKIAGFPAMAEAIQR
jgi:putative hemolysin